RVEEQPFVGGPGQRPATGRLPGAGARTVADLIAHRRPPAQLGVGPFEEVIKEHLLPPQALGGVVVAPLLAAMGVEPFARRADLLEAVEGAPGVQALVGQLATTKAGTVIRGRSAALLAQKSSKSGCSAVSAARSSTRPVPQPHRWPM